jgi:small subunit ribosomal protein S6
MDKERQQKYELLYIIPSKYTEDEVKSIMDKIKAIVTDGGLAVSEMHNLGKRRLAYPIKHVRFGNYVLVWFEGDKRAVAKLNEILRLSGDVLRHVIVSFNPLLNKIPNFAEEEAKRPASEESESRPVSSRKPTSQAPVKKDEPVNMEDLEEKLDKILNEEVE